jgi:hypothetical protein
MSLSPRICRLRSVVTVCYVLIWGYPCLTFPRSERRLRFKTVDHPRSKLAVFNCTAFTPAKHQCTRHVMQENLVRKTWVIRPFLHSSFRTPTVVAIYHDATPHSALINCSLPRLCSLRGEDIIFLQSVTLNFGDLRSYFCLTSPGLSAHTYL